MTIILPDPGPHPSWCVQPPEEADLSVHLGRVIACNPAGTEILGVAAQLYAHLPPVGNEPPSVALVITEDGIDQWYPMAVDQAVVLQRVLRTLLRQVGAVK